MEAVVIGGCLVLLYGLLSELKVLLVLLGLCKPAGESPNEPSIKRRFEG